MNASMGSRLCGLAVAVTIALSPALASGCAPATRPDVSKPASGRAGGGARRDALTPTRDDGLSPSYAPGAPIRSVVGTGHVLTGTLISSRDGSPISGARIELWPEYAGRGHPDEARATVVTDGAGRYRFQCDPPEHIHMRITAAGYVGIAQNGYHPGGDAEGTFDVVLRPK